MKTIKDKQLLVGADFAGFPLKEAVVAHLKRKGWTITDVGVRTDSDPNDIIPSGNGNGSLLFNRQYFPEGNFYKGAFFFIEPPYSVVGVGLDRYVLRGIYDMQGSEENEDGESALRSLSMQIELGECSVSDLSLEHRDPYFRLQNQKIPLLVEEKDGILWLNPGPCGPRRFHQEITMMMAELSGGAIQVEKVTIPHEVQ